MNGSPVPGIVREENGVINRSIYDFAILDPNAAGLATTSTAAATGAPAGPTADPGWNKRLVYRFGGGCGTGYSPGRRASPPSLDPALLSKGYAVVTSTLNTFQTACNATLVGRDGDDGQGAHHRDDRACPT